MSSSSRYLFLDFQCPVSASSLSEVSSEDTLTRLRRLRRLSSESELGGLSLEERLLARKSCFRFYKLPGGRGFLSGLSFRWRGGILRPPGPTVKRGCRDGPFAEGTDHARIGASKGWRPIVIQKLGESLYRSGLRAIGLLAPVPVPLSLDVLKTDLRTKETIAPFRLYRWIVSRLTSA
ncbi:hypothetical protein Tco_0218679 [Tanacetum coccineum]